MTVVIAPRRYNSPLRQVAASREQQVGARRLWRERREIVAREQQLKCERRRRHAEAHADVEEDAEEREHVRGLAHEEIVQRDVGEDERDSRRKSAQPAQTIGQPMADELHEAELVELTAQRKEHGKPDEDAEHLAFLRDVAEA
jgi:hypothetical protein